MSEGRSTGPGTGPMYPDQHADDAERARSVRRRTSVGVAAVALVAVALGVAALTWRSPDVGDPDASAAAGQTATTTPGGSGSPSQDQSPTPTADPTTPPPVTAAPTDASLPLRPLTERFTSEVTSIVSDTPDAGDRLADGDYFGTLVAADPGGRTVSVDLGIFYGGTAAEEYVRTHEPDFWAGEGGTVPNGYWIVNDVERIRVLPVSPDVAVATWCFSTGSGGGAVVRDFEEWAAAATSSAPLVCESPDPAVRQANDLYWFDVRGGEVVQVVGQYVP
ncbi:MAG: hypothetical protein HGA44_04735 [Cellulomonadaceae bacterium]|nr:hypothetical protein [Cellulomonadaceae bacterium]